MIKITDSKIKPNHLRLALVGLWFLCLAWLYRSALLKTIEGFLNPKNEMVYGWLVVPVAIGMAVFQRKKLSSAAGRPAGGGIVMLFFALVLHVYGKQFNFPVLSQLAMILSVPAVAWAGWGREVAKILFFPSLFLLYIIPIPFRDILAENLNLFSRWGAAGLLNGFGWNAEKLDEVPVLVEKTLVTFQGIFLTNYNEFCPPKNIYQYEVEDVCCGLRSITAISIIAAIYGFTHFKRTFRTFLLMGCSLFFVLIANIIRITVMCACSQFWGQERIHHVLHDPIGYLVFGIAIFLIPWLLDKRLDKIGKDPPEGFLPPPPARQLGWVEGIFCLVLGVVLTVIMFFMV